MSRQDDQLTIRRILVALDASYHSLAALEAAAELAASMEAELQALFVEDANLLRLAGLPLAREIRYPFVIPVRLDRARMERALRAQAAQARQALARASEERHIKWSFRVVRGEVAPEVLAAAMEADLLTLGKASRPLTLRVRLGSTARAAAARAPCCVLLLQRDVGIRSPVLVTYDGTPSTQQALTMAARLAQKHGGDLTILIIADAPHAAQRLQAQVSDLLRGRGLVVRYRRLTDPGAATLIHEVRTEGSGVLVLSSTVLPQEALQTLLDEVGCPVLLMR
jgi:nucleotide-binding universal stress UspA family protein